MHGFLVWTACFTSCAASKTKSGVTGFLAPGRAGPSPEESHLSSGSQAKAGLLVTVFRAHILLQECPPKTAKLKPAG